jgi:hypothetical protein
VNHPYFTGRKTAICGQFRNLDTEGLKRAVVKMGGTMANIGSAEVPDNIVVGWYATREDWTQIEAQYPDDGGKDRRLRPGNRRSRRNSIVVLISSTPRTDQFKETDCVG